MIFFGDLQPPVEPWVLIRNHVCFPSFTKEWNMTNAPRPMRPRVPFGVRRPHTPMGRLLKAAGEIAQRAVLVLVST